VESTVDDSVVEVVLGPERKQFPILIWHLRKPSLNRLGYFPLVLIDWCGRDLEPLSRPKGLDHEPIPLTMDRDGPVWPGSQETSPFRGIGIGMTYRVRGGPFTADRHAGPSPLRQFRRIDEPTAMMRCHQYVHSLRGSEAPVVSPLLPDRRSTNSECPACRTNSTRLRLFSFPSGPPPVDEAPPSRLRQR